MKEAFDAIASKNGSLEKWMNTYYQLGNRLAFQYKISQKRKRKNKSYRARFA